MVANLDHLVVQIIHAVEHGFVIVLARDDVEILCGPRGVVVGRGRARARRRACPRTELGSSEAEYSKIRLLGLSYLGGVHALYGIGVIIPLCLDVIVVLSTTMLRCHDTVWHTH